MTTTAVRTALVAMLTGISGIGRVHEWERFAAKNDKFIELYAGGAGAPVLGWHVRRLSVLRRRALASGRVLVATRWLIQGFASIVDADASELQMDDLVDAITASERADPTLGGVVRGLPVDGQAGVRLAESGPVMFAGVLCHNVKLVLDVETLEEFAGANSVATIAGAQTGLVGAVVDRLISETGTDFERIEGRPIWDPDDVAANCRAAIVVPMADRAEPTPETIAGRQRVDRRIGVIVVAPSSHDVGAGDLVAGGVSILRRAVIAALLEWGTGVDGVDIPLLYAGAEAVTVAPGLVAWREIFQPSTYLEP